jgi:hypothetical protein
MRSAHLLLGALIFAGGGSCSVSTDYGGTGYRCADGICPAGQTCVAGFCQPAPADAAPADAPDLADATPSDATLPDAAPPDAAPPDAAPDAHPPCTGGDEAVLAPDLHCYLRFDTGASRDEAITACTDLGGNLASLDTAPVNTAVMAALVDTDIPLDTPYWIGLDDIATEMDWVWLDGSAFSFSDWLPGEPNDSSGQDCGVVMVDSASGPGWNDRGCSNTLGYLCETP